RVLERRAAQQAAAGVEGAGDGVDGGHLERVAVVEVRQETGEPGGQHGLAGTGRADHEEVVPAGGGDLEGEAGVRLSDDVGEVRGGGPWRGRWGVRRLGGGRGDVGAVLAGELGEVVHPADPGSRHEPGLGEVRGGDDDVGAAG